MPRCSVLNSTGQSGNTIRQWFEKQPNSVKDYIKTTYCTRYKGDQSTDECACINRDQYPIFQQIDGDLKSTGNGGIQATCWWAGCKDANRFFIRSDEPPCNVTSVCEIINHFDNDNINQSDFNSQTSCNNSGGGGGGGRGITYFEKILNLFHAYPEQSSALLIIVSVILILSSMFDK